MEIWKCLITLSVTILLIMLGSKVVYNDRIAVIEGNIMLEASPDNSSHQTSWQLNFPNGFNSNNCVCVAFGTKLYADSKAGYAYGTGFEGAIGLGCGDIPKSIELGQINNLDKIWCQAYNTSGAEKTLYYRIVLLKTR